jgi:hypothetical protein
LGRQEKVAKSKRVDREGLKGERKESLGSSMAVGKELSIESTESVAGKPLFVQPPGW